MPRSSAEEPNQARADGAPIDCEIQPLCLLPKPATDIERMEGDRQAQDIGGVSCSPGELLARASSKYDGTDGTELSAEERRAYAVRSSYSGTSMNGSSPFSSCIWLV